jgi:hypothetical protein
MKTYFSLLLILSLPFCAHSQIQSRIHHPNIKTAFIKNEAVFIHPNVVLNIGSENKSSLQFDDLALNYPYYYFRLIHCQADWNPSPISTPLIAWIPITAAASFESKRRSQ